MNPLTMAIALLAAYIFGATQGRIYGFFRNVNNKLKHGICFNYKASGRRENRNGTVSDFCMKCGHPCGYHD